MKWNCSAIIDDYGIDGAVSLAAMTGFTVRIKRQPICGSDEATQSRATWHAQNMQTEVAAGELARDDAREAACSLVVNEWQWWRTTNEDDATVGDDAGDRGERVGRSTWPKAGGSRRLRRASEGGQAGWLSGLGTWARPRAVGGSWVGREMVWPRVGDREKNGRWIERERGLWVGLDKGALEMAQMIYRILENRKIN